MAPVGPSTLARLSLSQWIWLGLVAGVLVGLAFPGQAASLSVLADVFVRLLQMLVVPLVVSTLIVGIAGRKDARPLGRVLAATIAYFVVVTAVAGAVGLLAADWLRPGVGATITGPPIAVVPAPASPAPSLVETLVPASVAQAMGANNLLGVVFFTVLLAIGIAAVAPLASLLVEVAAALAAAMFRVTTYVMWCAPVAALGATAASVGRSGPGGLRPFLALVLVAYLALGAFAGVLLVTVSRLARIRLWPFLRAIGPALLVAFSTASGAAALPGALDGLERWGASRRVTSFVLPLGYSFNLAGTALYLPLVTVFWAQMQGVHLSWREQIVILGYLLVVIRGLPPVPRALFLVWGAALAEFRLPVEGVVVLLGIDPVVDMARTVVNVGGNCLAVAVVDRWQPSTAPQGPARPAKGATGA